MCAFIACLVVPVYVILLTVWRLKQKKKTQDMVGNKCPLVWKFKCFEFFSFLVGSSSVSVGKLIFHKHNRSGRFGRRKANMSTQTLREGYELSSLSISASKHLHCSI